LKKPITAPLPRFKTGFILPPDPLAFRVPPRHAPVVPARRSFVLAFLAAALDAAAQQEIPAPKRPERWILDETASLTATERDRIAAEFDRTAKELGLGLFLVLRRHSTDESPQDLARRMAQSWLGTADRVVILRTPDLAAPAVVAYAGETLDSIPPEDLEGLTRTAVAAASAASTTAHGALLEMARAITRQIAAYRSGGSLAPPVAASPVARSAEISRHAALLWGSVAALIAGAAIVAWRRRGRRSALIFPATAPRRRFSAPHSGGNNAVVQFRPKQQSSPPLP
jgi:uncharacterized membrane protein YgcG